MIDPRILILVLEPTDDALAVEPIGGLPLMVRAIRLGRFTAQALGSQSRVVCASSDPAIAALAIEWGADQAVAVPVSGRYAEAIQHALDLVQGQWDMVVVLDPTYPLTDREDVLAAVDLYCRCGDPVVVANVATPPTESDRRESDTRLPPVVVAEADSPGGDGDVVSPHGAVLVGPPSFSATPPSVRPAHRTIALPAGRAVVVRSRVDLEVARALATQPVVAVSLSGRLIGDGQPCFVIAEAGVNHNGSLAVARQLVDAAAAAGADAVKFQTFSARRLVTRDAPKAEYQTRATGHGSQFEMLERLELSEGDHRALMAHCATRGILFLSSPFDEVSCDLLVELGLPALKLPSGELTNLPFLGHAAMAGVPLIVSTGMATLREVAVAVDHLRRSACRDLILLHCVSNYPAPPETVNLRAMGTLREAFAVPVGFSDHTAGDAIPLAAVARGACVIEKHLTLDRTLPGPDHQASMEPAAFADMVSRIRAVEASLGHGRKEPAASESAVAAVARKSLVAARDIRRGATIDASMLAVRRPGTGLAPAQLGQVLGRTAVVAVAEGTPLQREMFS